MYGSITIKNKPYSVDGKYKAVTLNIDFNCYHIHGALERMPQEDNWRDEDHKIVTDFLQLIERLSIEVQK